MSYDKKQYLDKQGLDTFWTQVKKFYSHDETAVVDQAEKLENTRVFKLAGDVTGKASFDGTANAIIETSVDIRAIEDHEILKIFGKKVKASDYESIAAAIADVPSGSTITLDATSAAAMVADPMTYGSGSKAGFHVDNKDLTVEVPAGITLDFTSANCRAFDLRDGATLEIKGAGTIITSGDNPSVFVGKDANLIIDGVTLSNPTGAYNIASNGNNQNTNVWIKSGTFNGINYLPARGSLRIDGGTFTNNQGSVLYIKNGSPTEITGGTFVVTGLSTEGDTVPGRPANAWAHNNNGQYGIASAVVIEACNYGGHGNPTVKITGGTFNPGQDGYDILVINYAGQVADMTGTTVSYRQAEVSGHLSNNTGEPSDGWYYFTDENTTEVAL